MNLSNWIKSLRLPFLIATVVPVFLGTAIAWDIRGIVDWKYFFLSLFGVAFIHIGTNLTNDYFDHKSGNDKENISFSPISGGSRVIQDGLISPKAILSMALVFFSFGIIIGLYIVWSLKSILILTIGLFGVLFGFFYTASPLRIGYRGYGELIVGLCFGPLVVFGSYYIQTMNFSIIPILASISLGILIFMVLIINEFPDYRADKNVNKNTMVVILGKDNSIKFFHFLLFGSFVYILICVLLGLMPVYSLIVCLLIPFAVKIFNISKANYLEVESLRPANFMTIGLHFSFGILLTLSFILDKIL